MEPYYQDAHFTMASTCGSLAKWIVSVDAEGTSRVEVGALFVDTSAGTTLKIRRAQKIIAGISRRANGGPGKQNGSVIPLAQGTRTARDTSGLKLSTGEDGRRSNVTHPAARVNKDTNPGFGKPIAEV